MNLNVCILLQCSYIVLTRNRSSRLGPHTHNLLPLNRSTVSNSVRIVDNYSHLSGSTKSSTKPGVRETADHSCTPCSKKTKFKAVTVLILNRLKNFQYLIIE